MVGFAIAGLAQAPTPPSEQRAASPCLRRAQPPHSGKNVYVCGVRVHAGEYVSVYQYLQTCAENFLQVGLRLVCVRWVPLGAPLAHRLANYDWKAS